MYPGVDRSAPRMRVLVSGCLPPPIGGMATFYEILLGSSLPQRVDLSFVQTSSQKREFSTSGRISTFNMLSATLDCWRFFTAVQKQRPQIAHIGTAFGLSFVKNSVCTGIARLLGCKVLLHPHCSFAVLYSERPRWWQWYFRQLILLVHGVIALSQEWTDLTSVVPDCRVYHLPNAVNVALFRDVAEKQLSEEANNHPLQVLYLGYLGKEKGTFDLLEAVKLAKILEVDLHFTLIGSELIPGELQQLQDVIQSNRLDSHVEIHPAIFGSEKLEMLRQADFFIYPSHHEGMPMAVIEAMACGLPIVATNVGGLPDLIQDRVTGLLVEPSCPDQMLEALRTLQSDHRLRNAIKRNGFQLAVNKFDIEKRVNQLVDIYQLALSARKPTYRHVKPDRGS